MWISTDPALGEYVPGAGADSSKLPGMGGVFNPINFHLYHYAGNNPVRYTDPDGQFAIPVLIIGVGLLYAALKTYYDNVNYSNSSSNSFSGFNDTGIYSTDGLGEPNFAKKNKQKESDNPSLLADKGNGSAATGGTPDGKNNRNNDDDEPDSVSKMQNEVQRGKAPKTVDRVDKGRGNFEKDHVHFKGKKNEQSALNNDGTWKHGSKKLNNNEIEWLQKHNWKLPKE